MTNEHDHYGGRGIRCRHPATPGLVSVVMPCYNAAGHLREAVESVLAQSHPTVELVVVDDGSTDGSPELARELAAAHPQRIRLLAQPNQGPYPARNRGLEVARGELVAFLDADDYWDRECIAKLYAAVQREDAPLAYCGWQNVGEGSPGTRPYVPPDYAAEDPAALFLRGCPWPIHAALVRRDLVERVGGFSERYFTSLDYDFWLRILAVTHHLVRVPEVLAYYRWHGSGQISAIRDRQVIEAWRVRRDFVRHFPGQVAHLPRVQRRELLHGALRRAAYEAFWRRDLSTAQALFRHALAHGAIVPRDLRYVLPAMLPGHTFARVVGLLGRPAARSRQSE